MSLADSWQQVFAGAHARPDTWCVGCGYWPVVNGRCRDDCTARHAERRNSFRAHLTPRRAKYSHACNSTPQRLKSLAVEDLALLPVSVWKARMSGLRAWETPDDDPRMRPCLAALTYYRMRKAVDREVEAGYMTRSFADNFLEKLRWFDAGDDPAQEASEASGDAESERTSGVAEDAPEAVDAAAVERPAAVAAGVVSAAAPR